MYGDRLDRSCWVGVDGRRMRRRKWWVWEWGRGRGGESGSISGSSIIKTPAWLANICRNDYVTLH